ncbi:NAD(P)/FAD-dependent oxidoreductase [Nocardia sp. BMG51109]|uniref:flavin-containing monooxygenase n=1 Tax=Nocardia sp. BMG51109 TaxID=1056816 RepID=UPI000463C7A3|nr:NAD(P)/FAD-dependent oxidoreductase [Nocardia sp. BMG51109]
MSTATAPSVAVIGAGFGGLAAAIELQRNGIDYVVYERADSLGGVWHANRYPGVACDLPSSIYAYSYALGTSWSRRFAGQPEILDYLRHTADRFGVTGRIRFGAEVTAATFADDGWLLEFGDGTTRRHDAVIAATGVLSRPKMPEVEGVGEFRGVALHSAQWDESVDLAGKKVVVVGNGASAIQLVPAIVDRVAELTVVQRSPNWVVDRHDRKTTWIGRTLARVPGFPQAQHRLTFLWNEHRAPLIFRSLDPVRAVVQAWVKLKIRRQIRDPELRKTVTPDYPAFCNRLLISDEWYPALDRSHVSVYRQGLGRVTPEGVTLDDGRAVPADVIIWCTGFRTEEYLAPIDITGRDGRKLHAEWKSGPQAYLGVAVSGFPNLFMISGPGTGGTTTNSFVYILERQARYVRKALQHLGTAGGWLDVLPEVQRRHNSWRRERLSKTVYSGSCPGWYTTSDGSAAPIWPGSHLSYGRATRTFEPGEYARGGTG